MTTANATYGDEQDQQYVMAAIKTDVQVFSELLEELTERSALTWQDIDRLEEQREIELCHAIWLLSELWDGDEKGRLNSLLGSAADATEDMQRESTLSAQRKQIEKLQYAQEKCQTAIEVIEEASNERSETVR